MPGNAATRILYLLVLSLFAGLISSALGIAQTERFTLKQHLGKFLYFDENLSEPSGQSCASCHLPESGFADPDSTLPVSKGVDPKRFGERNSPSAAYAMYAPSFHFDSVEELFIGGQFWDGRATGYVLSDPLADQALVPFMNPVEMANPDKTTVIRDVLASDYKKLFIDVCGPVNLNVRSQVSSAYDCVALSIAAFERTSLFGQFNSKYDYYLKKCLAAGGDKDNCAQGIGKAAKQAGRIFSQEEWYGMQLFMGQNNNDGNLDQGEGAMCAECHIVEWQKAEDNVHVPAWAPSGWVPPMFTDFTFDNLGVPKNTEYPLDPNAHPDLGLGGELGNLAENGKFKVMTIRNIDLTAPYAHNGYFKGLKEITHFYSTRDVPGSLEKGADWPPPEYPATINRDELGNLGLSDNDENALVKFMKTLSDGWTP